MIDERIVQHLENLARYLLELKIISNVKLTEFINDDLKAFAAERLFQTAIESCINIGNRIIAIEQNNYPLKPPEKYSDIAERLRELNIIDAEFKEIFVKMIKFRNRLVHIYWEIDREELYSYLKNNLSDFDSFISLIKNYLNNSNFNL